MKNKKISYITEAAMIAALYAVLTYSGSIFNLSYGAVQLRFSEALTILPIFFKSAIPGLSIGCFISNLASPHGFLDVFLGTTATFLAALLTYKFRNCKVKGFPLLSMLCPVIINALIIPVVIALTTDSSDFLLIYTTNAITIAIGELLSCVFLGGLLWKIIIKRNIHVRKEI